MLWRSRSLKAMEQLKVASRDLTYLLRPSQKSVVLRLGQSKSNSSPQISSPDQSEIHRSCLVEDDRSEFRIGDFLEERDEMGNIGLDVGTKTIVLAYENDKGKTKYVSEINGFFVYERSNQFVLNMLNDPTKVRSDGSKRPARWFQMDGDQRIVVVGRDGEELAYAHNDTLRRPMAEGGVTADEDSITVLASIIRSLLETAEKDVGKWKDEIKLAYCTTAPAINKDGVNVAYHEQVVDMILQGYQTESGLKVSKLKESHAIVINESPDASGIGISWGAGTVTVSYVKYGMEVFSFCWVGAGDWIDEQVAARHGYVPASKLKGKQSRETPTTVAKRKHTLDLTPGKEPQDRVGLDLVLHYRVLMSNVIDGIAQGFMENETQARIDEGVNVYMAGGTSSPEGFEKRVAEEFATKRLPFEIGAIKRAQSPLFTVAEGLLKASKMS